VISVSQCLTCERWTKSSFNGKTQRAQRAQSHRERNSDKNSERQQMQESLYFKNLYISWIVNPSLWLCNLCVSVFNLWTLNEIKLQWENTEGTESQRRNSDKNSERQQMQESLYFKNLYISWIVNPSLWLCSLCVSVFNPVNVERHQASMGKHRGHRGHRVTEKKLRQEFGKTTNARIPLFHESLYFMNSESVCVTLWISVISVSQCLTCERWTKSSFNGKTQRAVSLCLSV
jgi:hypothetical protein